MFYGKDKTKLIIMLNNSSENLIRFLSNDIRLVQLFMLLWIHSLEKLKKNPIFMSDISIEERSLKLLLP